jgi:HD-like signal output (HDOD) protein
MKTPAPTSSPPAPAASRPPTTALTQKIAADLDRQRQSGPLNQITIPPCPQLLLRLQAALAEAEPDLQEVSRIASSDVAMAATLLRNANSARYTTDQPVRTVGQAMNRLGLEVTATVLTEVLLRQAIRADHPRLKRFWEQSAQRAAAMHFLARQLPGVTPEVAQLYGLFCHVGVPVLLQRMPGYSGTLVEAGARRDRSMVATENENHRTDHAVVGALVARVWQVAPPVMTAIRLHHDFAHLASQGADPEVQTLVALGLLAEGLVRQREGLPAEHDWQQHAGAAREWLGITEDLVADWNHELQAVLDAA